MSVEAIEVLLLVAFVVGVIKGVLDAVRSP